MKHRTIHRHVTPPIFVRPHHIPGVASLVCSFLSLPYFKWTMEQVETAGCVWTGQGNGILGRLVIVGGWMSFLPVQSVHPDHASYAESS
ncbi:hypothetical protein K505DRAFT_138531 [Melanomma pulvis-pyrius CBS 109.77]|uniref:Uncharacterized protein n=1 Tax=Melanomma pulvis-pyrius CBS 109.77 TaxID=1314802 RepID=A0A6A6XMJ1_9PLEO|nr:hypothetical protein K505DRAFT_138531 [Melanomma pulvis-pyrius CBS 109.77]